MSEWTPAAQAAITLCEDWAKEASTSVNCQFFLLGSAIYKGGEQFDCDQSDLDIVAVFNNSESTALARFEQLLRLHNHKSTLELNMIPALRRGSCTEPGVSIVAITEFELHTNIHKSGARRFFDKNFFYNLDTKEQSLGLPGAGTKTIPDENRYAIEFVQRTRNDYLSVCANGAGGIEQYNGLDPLPKAQLRIVAQLLPNTAEGEWYDTRHGLEHMFETLRARRPDDPLFGEIFDIVSVRRGGRGTAKPLTAKHQLLLSELVFDYAAQVATDIVITWEIRITGISDGASEVLLIFDQLRKFAHDAQLVGHWRGSVILRVRSALSGYETLQRLHEIGALTTLIGGTVCSLERVDLDGDSSPPQADTNVFSWEARLQRWTPSPPSSPRELEDELYAYLRNLLAEDSRLAGAQIIRDAAVNPGSARPGRHIDFRVSRKDATDEEETTFIELMWLREAYQFYGRLPSLLSMDGTLIIVVVAAQSVLEKIQPDVMRLALLSGRITVVKIPVNH